MLVDVVADHWPDHDAYVLPVAERVASCVPGRHRRIVLSQGTVVLLTTQELDAVLRHERAPARGRHDLALLPFVALTHAFPWLTPVRTARQAVAVLLEMIADDHACRAHGELPLARALVRMAAGESAPGPAATFALADAGVVERLQRLLSRRDQPRWVPAAASSTAGHGVTARRPGSRFTHAQGLPAVLIAAGGSGRPSAHRRATPQATEPAAEGLRRRRGRLQRQPGGARRRGTGGTLGRGGLAGRSARFRCGPAADLQAGDPGLPDPSGALQPPMGAGEPGSRLHAGAISHLQAQNQQAMRRRHGRAAGRRYTAWPAPSWPPSKQRST
ncbi:M56 family metallopeptidase [Nonomuraea sp. GTA35]|uniref:M56 family metallopeptidase n=1 Tax=Nonomuraea sp. GTA35 TaxID=1676746 RepID=UPI0035BFAE2E